jgi:sugar phosphate permease
MKLSKGAKNAIMIGTLCSVSYFSVYVARNILGAVTPQLVAAGYTKAYVGSISSLYFIFYAFGQLINGFIGERIKAKWMISVGLLGGGITNLVFSNLVANKSAAMIAYGMTGLFLSMIYGPMTKVVSENNETKYAVRCSLGYDFASFFGSPAAGLLASFLVWSNVFRVSTIAMAVMSILIFSFFTMFERKGIVKYGQYKPKEKGVANVKVLFKHQIVKFSMVSILTGIVRTSVVFWLPTFLNEYHRISESRSAMVFSGITLALSFCSFVSVFVYERLGHNMNLAVLIYFSGAAIFFLLTFLAKAPILGIAMLILAILSSNCAASMLWSRYCPGLRDTGMVSSATGFLDFLSYMASAAANLIFPRAVSVIGWGGLILVWFGLMAVGVIISLPYDKMRKAA